MLNEYAAGVERKNFQQIADRFKEIHEEDIVDVRPEIGVPILDRLSVTHDPDLRQLFIELLASAADKNTVTLAHPSFVRVIESLSPDEAKILSDWKDREFIPCVMIGYKSEDGHKSIYDPYVEVPDSVSSPDLASMYISNLEGLGLLAHHSDRHLTAKDAYSALIDGIKAQHPNVKAEDFCLSE